MAKVANTEAPPGVAAQPARDWNARTLLTFGLSGFWFSIWIPLAAWVQAAFSKDSNSFWDTVRWAHETNPVVWLFDLAPFLGAFFAIWLRTHVASLRKNLDGVQHEMEERDRLHTADRARIDARARELDRLTELHQAAARRFEELFQGLPVACFTYDREGVLFECNREMERLWGLEACQVQLKPVSDMIVNRDNEALWESLTKRVFDGGSVYNVEMCFPTGGPVDRWVLCSSFPLRSTEDKVVGAISAMVDISLRKEMEQQIEAQMETLNTTALQLTERSDELEAANARLALLAATDGLTGVANRRLFRERLEAECRAASPEKPLSIVMLDLDNFKLYNDEFGHQAGDDLLKGVAETLKESVRQLDLAARFGGEEFVLLLPNTGSESALAIAERVRKRIEESKGCSRTMTASLGITTVLESDDDPRGFLEQADEAMYASKRAGRNRVTHWDDLAEEQSQKAA